MSKEFSISSMPEFDPEDSSKAGTKDDSDTILIRSLRDTELQHPRNSRESLSSVNSGVRVERTETRSFEANVRNLHARALDLAKGFVQMFDFGAAERVTNPQEWSAAFRKTARGDRTAQELTSEFTRFYLIFPKLLERLQQQGEDQRTPESLGELYILTQSFTELFAKLKSKLGQEHTQGRKIATLTQALDEYVGARKEILQRVLSAYPDALRKEARDSSTELEARLEKIEALEAEEARARADFERAVQFDQNLEAFFESIASLKEHLEHVLHIKPVSAEVRATAA